MNFFSCVSILEYDDISPHFFSLRFFSWPKRHNSQFVDILKLEPAHSNSLHGSSTYLISIASGLCLRRRMITRIIIFLSINVYISPKDKNIKVSLIPKHHKTKHHKKVIRSVNWKRKNSKWLIRSRNNVSRPMKKIFNNILITMNEIFTNTNKNLHK